MLPLMQETRVTHVPKPRSSRSADRWENEGGPSRSPPLSSDDGMGSELKRLGIASVELTVFDWNGYRYSNARDAIAAAKRLQSVESAKAGSSNV